MRNTPQMMTRKFKFNSRPPGFYSTVFFPRLFIFKKKNLWMFSIIHSGNNAQYFVSVEKNQWKSKSQMYSFLLLLLLLSLSWTFISLFLYISYTKLRNNYYQYFRVILYWFPKKMAQIWSVSFQFCSSFNT